LLRCRIKLFAERHDVYAVLTKSRSDRGGRISLPSRDLQLDRRNYFFCHSLTSFYLPILQLDWSRAAENAYGHAQFAAFGVDLFYYPTLILEGTVCYFYGLAYLKTDLWFNLIFTLPDLSQHVLDLLRTHRDRSIFGARESQNTGSFPNEIPGSVDQLVLLIQQIHVHDQVPRKELARRFGAFAAFDLGNAFGRNQNLVHDIAHFLGLDSPD